METVEPLLRDLLQGPSRPQIAPDHQHLRHPLLQRVRELQDLLRNHAGSVGQVLRALLQHVDPWSVSSSQNLLLLPTSPRLPQSHLIHPSLSQSFPSVQAPPPTPTPPHPSSVTAGIYESPPLTRTGTLRPTPVYPPPPGTRPVSVGKGAGDKGEVRI